MVELLVSIGIVVLVLSVVVTRQDAFNGAVLLRGQAYDIALAIREIQLGSVSAASDGSGGFRSVQGVYFDKDNNQQYRIFRDANNNNFWDPNEDMGFSGLLDPRFELREILLGTESPDELSIVFKRPNFDAIFVTGPGTESSEQSVVIRVSVRGAEDLGICGEDFRDIEVTATGQIAVLECQP